MGLYSTKRLTQQIFQPVIHGMVRARVSPDWMTGGAVLLGLVAGMALLLASQSREWLWLVVVFAPLRLLFNIFDGELARGLGVADRWGEVKNELGDVVADALIFGALALSSLAPSILTVPVLILVILSEFTGVLAKAVTGQREYGGLMGKPDRMLALVLACVIMALTGWQPIFSAVLVIILVLEIQTIYVRLEAIHDR